MTLAVLQLLPIVQIKNLTCTWNEVATGSDYVADTAGSYRLVITYQNGCFNRFYFDVFQNNLSFGIFRIKYILFYARKT